jgi:hypothetical protein
MEPEKRDSERRVQQQQQQQPENQRAVLARSPRVVRRSEEGKCYLLSA